MTMPCISPAATPHPANTAPHTPPRTRDPSALFPEFVTVRYDVDLAPAEELSYRGREENDLFVFRNRSVAKTAIPTVCGTLPGLPGLGLRRLQQDGVLARECPPTRLLKS